MKKNSKSPRKKEQKAKRAQAQRPEQREPKEVVAELVEKLRGKLELKARSASPAEGGPRAELGPNLARLRHLSRKLCLKGSCLGLETALEHDVELRQSGGDRTTWTTPALLFEA